LGLIPDGLKFVAIDGDTQTAARNLADGLQPGLFEEAGLRLSSSMAFPRSKRSKSSPTAIGSA